MGDLSTSEEIDYSNPPFPLTAIDRDLLSMKDEDFHLITWEDLKHIIATNTLENLKRLPSDLRRYLAWSYTTKQHYTNLTSFVLKERLFWTPLPTSPNLSSPSTGPPAFKYETPIPFASPKDFAVLKNDWPYGLAPNITHLLVWSKVPIPVDSTRGDVTPQSRRVIEEFVEKVFVKELGEAGRAKVVWFKNWVSLQSVRGVDHVHVLVRDVPEEVLGGWLVRRDL